MSLVSEEVLLQHGHASGHAGRAAGRQRVQLDVGADQSRGELGVCGRTGSGTPDLRRDVVKLFAVLIGDNRAARSTGICGNLLRDEAVSQNEYSLFFLFSVW